MLRARVESFIDRHRLTEPGSKVVVAVSGGADSLCLVLLLHDLAEALGIRLHVAHLNHQLRPDAAEDARFVADVARRLGLPATIEARDVEMVRREQGLSIEAAARRVRYTFLRDVGEQTGSHRVAVGHTADDQAETVLLHVIRGAGMAGLRGMLPLTSLRLRGFPAPLTVVRPLLDVERRETEGYCREHGFEPRQDPTNWCPDFLRNRIRRELIPLLEASYNPGMRHVLIRTARAAADDYEYLAAAVGRAWTDVAVERPGRIELSLSETRALPRAIQRHLLRRAYATAVGVDREIGADHVERLLAMFEEPRTGARIELPGGVVFAISYQKATLGRAEPPLPEVVEGEVAVPGKTRLGGWTVSARIQENRPGEPSGGWVARLDFELIGPNLHMRRRRPGDRFQPLGLDGRKRLQDFFVDARVPQEWRDRVPIIESPQGIVWVAGWRIDDRFKVTPATRTILELEMERDDDVCD